MSKVHFISGLPRSGSTLLAGILRQNPRFHASMSSPVFPLMQSMLEQMGADGEFYTFFDNNKRKAMCDVLFNTYYKEHQQVDLIFDTNRNWTARFTKLLSFLMTSK